MYFQKYSTNLQHRTHLLVSTSYNYITSRRIIILSLPIHDISKRAKSPGTGLVFVKVFYINSKFAIIFQYFTDPEPFYCL